MIMNLSRNYHVRPRDEAGWIIPRDRTVAREIYDLAKRGLALTEINAAIKQQGIRGVPPSLIKQHLQNIQSPTTTELKHPSWSAPTLIELPPIIVSTVPLLPPPDFSKAPMFYVCDTGDGRWWAVARTPGQMSPGFMALEFSKEKAIRRLLRWHAAKYVMRGRTEKDFVVVGYLKNDVGIICGKP